MKSVLTIFIFVCLCVPGGAQTVRKVKAEAKPAETAAPQPQAAPASAPARKQGSRPKITLQRGMFLAEKYITAKKIDISSYYLIEARFIMFGPEDKKEPAWFFRWANENAAFGNSIEIVVFINTGEAKRTPSM